MPRFGSGNAEINKKRTCKKVIKINLNAYPLTGQIMFIFLQGRNHAYKKLYKRIILRAYRGFNLRQSDER